MIRCHKTLISSLLISLSQIPFQTLISSWFLISHFYPNSWLIILTPTPKISLSQLHVLIHLNPTFYFIIIAKHSYYISHISLTLNLIFLVSILIAHFSSTSDLHTLYIPIYTQYPSFYQSPHFDLIILQCSFNFDLSIPFVKMRLKSKVSPSKWKEVRSWTKAYL